MIACTKNNIRNNTSDNNDNSNNNHDRSQLLRTRKK